MRYIVDFRSMTDGNTVEGTAAVFNKFSRPEFAKQKGHLETIDRRAFDATLASGNDVRLLMDHNPSLLLARTASKTLELHTDDVGLQIRADLPDTSYARDLKALMIRGDVSHMSFGFNPKKDKWTSYQGMSVRTHTEVELGEVSILALPPVYTDTQVSLRSFEEFAIQPEMTGRTQLIIARHRINY